MAGLLEEVIALPGLSSEQVDPEQRPVACSCPRAAAWCVHSAQQRPGGTHADLRQRAIGFIDPAHRHGVTSGWKQILEGVVQDCSARASAQRT